MSDGKRVGVGDVIYVALLNRRAVIGKVAEGRGREA